MYQKNSGGKLFMSNNNELFYIEWVERFLSALEEYLKIENLRAEFVRQTVWKNNCEKEAIVIRMDESNVSPTVYPVDLFEKYSVSDVSVEDIAKHVLEQILEEKMNMKEFDVASVISEAYIKEHLSYRVINAGGNRKVAESSPVEYIADGELMLVPYVVVNEQEGQLVSFRLTDTIQREIKMTDDEVHKYAMVNLRADNFFLCGMNEMVREMMLKEGMPEEIIKTLVAEEDTMFVLTSNNKTNGAVGIAVLEVLEEAKSVLGEDNFFVIPSSVHEVILVPESMVSDPAELQTMCRDVNADKSLISTEDFLSNNIFLFDGNKQELHICNNLEQLRDLSKDAMVTKEFTISRRM